MFGVPTIFIELVDPLCYFMQLVYDGRELYSDPLTNMQVGEIDYHKLHVCTKNGVVL